MDSDLATVNLQAPQAARGGIDEFLATGKSLVSYIHVPKNVAIENLRLGVLQWVLKLAAGVWAVVLMFSLRAYDNFAVPSIGFLETWQEPAMGNVPGSNASYCTNPGEYDYVYSDDFMYNMSGCEYLPFGEAYTKRGGILFFPTSVDDVYVWTFGPSECDASNATAQDFCSAKGGTLRILGGQSGVACECLQHHSFFPVHPEGRRLFFSHGFEVSNLGVMGYGRMRGSTRLEKNQYSSGTGEDWQDLNDDGILTIIQDQSGETCNFGGSSRFLPAEARLGIGGSLSEWMACAGVNLEVADEKLRSGHSLETTAPKARLTGLELHVQLEYHNVHQEVDFSGIVCYARISAVQLWNSENSVKYGQLPDDTGRSSYRSRLQRGTEFRFVGNGRIEFLDFINLTTAISNALTIMSIPAILVGFLTLYCLGPLSDIYFAAANAQVHVPDDCKTAITRLITSEAALNSINDSKGIHRNDVRDVLARILEKHMGPKKGSSRRLSQAEKAIQENELENLVEFVMESIHKDGDPSIVDGQEYLRLHHRNDPVQLADIVKLFNEDRTQGRLEAFFQDHETFRRHKKAKGKAAETLEENLKGHRGSRGSRSSSHKGVATPMADDAVPISSGKIDTFQVEASPARPPRSWKKGHCAALLAKRDPE